MCSLFLKSYYTLCQSSKKGFLLCKMWLKNVPYASLNSIQWMDEIAIIKTKTFAPGLIKWLAEFSDPPLFKKFIATLHPFSLHNSKITIFFIQQFRWLANEIKLCLFHIWKHSLFAHKTRLDHQSQQTSKLSVYTALSAFTVIKSVQHTVHWVWVWVKVS